MHSVASTDASWPSGSRQSATPGWCQTTIWLQPPSGAPSEVFLAVTPTASPHVAVQRATTVHRSSDPPSIRPMSSLILPNDVPRTAATACDLRAMANTLPCPRVCCRGLLLKIWIKPLNSKPQILFAHRHHYRDPIAPGLDSGILRGCFTTDQLRTHNVKTDLLVLVDKWSAAELVTNSGQYATRGG